MSSILDLGQFFEDSSSICTYFPKDSISNVGEDSFEISDLRSRRRVPKSWSDFVWKLRKNRYGRKYNIVVWVYHIIFYTNGFVTREREREGRKAYRHYKLMLILFCVCCSWFFWCSRVSVIAGSRREERRRKTRFEERSERKCSRCVRLDDTVVTWVDDWDTEWVHNKEEVFCTDL